MGQSNVVDRYENKQKAHAEALCTNPQPPSSSLRASVRVRWIDESAVIHPDVPLPPVVVPAVGVN